MRGRDTLRPAGSPSAWALPPTWPAASHHAFPDHGEGFCVLHDPAIALRALLAEGSIRRAAVIDLDVHHGNGTAAIFAADPQVFTCSIHQQHNYPADKPPSDLDLGLADGAGWCGLSSGPRARARGDPRAGAGSPGVYRGRRPLHRGSARRARPYARRSGGARRAGAGGGGRRPACRS